MKAEEAATTTPALVAMTAADRVGELERYTLALKAKIAMLEEENRKMRDELSFHRRGIL